MCTPDRLPQGPRQRQATRAAFISQDRVTTFLHSPRHDWEGQVWKTLICMRRLNRCITVSDNLAPVGLHTTCLTTLLVWLPGSQGMRLCRTKELFWPRGQSLFTFLKRVLLCKKNNLSCPGSSGCRTQT